MPDKNTAARARSGGGPVIRPISRPAASAQLQRRPVRLARRGRQLVVKP